MCVGYEVERTCYYVVGFHAKILNSKVERENSNLEEDGEKFAYESFAH
jgi:hypothetical protein